MSVQRTRDSLSWFARARLGEGGAFLAGGRFARPADRQTDRVLAVGLDSLALHVPGDAWVLEDLGSTNGTYLDRTKVTDPTPVPVGVPIRIGKTTLELRK